MKKLLIIFLFYLEVFPSHAEPTPTLDRAPTTAVQDAAQKILVAFEKTKKLTDTLEDSRKLPDFSKSPGVLLSLWEDSKRFLGGGDDARVFLVRSKIDRPGIGLKKGQEMALRISRREDAVGTRKSMSDKYYTIYLSSKLSALDNNRQEKDNVTPFFPKHYGFYYGPAIEDNDSLIFSFPEESLASSPGRAKYVNLYEEMEYLPEYFKADTDSEFFEYCFGQWAGAVIASADTSLDTKDANYRGIKADYFRVYHLGDEIYLFPPSMIPKRIDLDSIKYVPPANKKGYYYKCKMPYGVRLSALSQKAYDELDKKMTIFEIFSKFFSAYKVSPSNPIPKSGNIRHFYVDKKLTVPE